MSGNALDASNDWAQRGSSRSLEAKIRRFGIPGSGVVFALESGRAQTSSRMLGR